MGGELLGEIALSGAGHDGGELLHLLGARVARHGGILNEGAGVLAGATADAETEALGSWVKEVRDAGG